MEPHSPVQSDNSPYKELLKSVPSACFGKSTVTRVRSLWLSQSFPPGTRGRGRISPLAQPTPIFLPIPGSDLVHVSRLHLERHGQLALGPIIFSVKTSSVYFLLESVHKSL